MHWNACIKNQSWPNLRCHSSIHMEEMTKTTKSLGRNSNCLDDMNATPRRSVTPCDGQNKGHPLHYEGSECEHFQLLRDNF